MESWFKSCLFYIVLMQKSLALELWPTECRIPMAQVRKVIAMSTDMSIEQDGRTTFSSLQTLLLSNIKNLYKSLIKKED